jgi:transglutaminase-like putative cysteine protease
MVVLNIPYEARARLLVITVFFAAMLIVAGEVPYWTGLVAAVCAVGRFFITLGSFPPPRPRKGMRFLFGAITALLVGGVLVNFRTLNGLAAGTALLVVMGALKLVESRGRRDDGIVIGVSLFMLLAAALADQSLSRLPLYLLVIWGACAAMMLVAHPGPGPRLRPALRLSARALLMAVPLAAACFLFFPRFSSQFWALPGGRGASTGLSDQMSPGAIDRLVADYEPAFRVRFEGAVPPPQFRYWRGPVLNSFDGFTWRREWRLYVDTPREMLGEPVRYRITLEPTQQPWLFALDTVDRSPRYDMIMAPDRQLSRNEPVTEVLSYDASSHLQMRATGPLSPLARRYETQLPATRNPRALALARELRARAPDDAAYSQMVLDWFRDNGLEYTLQPEPTGVESVDSVLFDTKQGFCGHFASAYATLMRAVGIPARVVTGYLGGDWNPVGSYLIVHQSDAHAWTEIWLDGRGWTRIDPTAAVEPERLTRGAYDLMGEASTPMGISLLQNTWVARLAQYWDGANTWWRERVVEFDLRSQLNLLARLGIDSPSWRHLGWAFGGALLAWLVWVTVSLRRSVAREKPDRIARAWLKATRKLEKIAAPRAPDEGALTYAQRISAQHPHLAAGITAVALRYVQLRYGPDAANEDIDELEREVSRLAV